MLQKNGPLSDYWSGESVLATPILVSLTVHFVNNEDPSIDNLQDIQLIRYCTSLIIYVNDLEQFTYQSVNQALTRPCRRPKDGFSISSTSKLNLVNGVSRCLLWLKVFLDMS